MTRFRSSVPAALATAAALAWCVGAYASLVKYPTPARNEALAAGAGLSATATITAKTDGSKVTRLAVRDTQTRATRLTRVVSGAWALPRPVRGGNAEGLAWNGSLAVLRSVAKPGRFVIVPLDRKGSARIVDFSAKGTFEFDALSASGSSLYLSEYTSPSATVLDRIRVYNTRTGTLRAQPVVDKLDGGETMAGVPLARVHSTDGATVYTLYESRAHPFVHVLLTGDAISLCLDIPASGNPSSPGSWKLSLNNATGTLRAASSRLGKAFVIDVNDSIGTIVRIEPLTRTT